MGFQLFWDKWIWVTFPENNLNSYQCLPIDGRFWSYRIGLWCFSIWSDWSYQIAEGLFIAIQPNFNRAMLELMPNPTANPTLAGYPSPTKPVLLVLAHRRVCFYESNEGFSFGLSINRQQNFQEFEFENTYLDGQTSSNTLDLDYPAIYSAGTGYSIGDFDIADFRWYVDYENTNGFSESGWPIQGLLQVSVGKYFKFFSTDYNSGA